MWLLQCGACSLLHSYEGVSLLMTHFCFRLKHTSILVGPGRFQQLRFVEPEEQAWLGRYTERHRFTCLPGIEKFGATDGALRRCLAGVGLPASATYVALQDAVPFTPWNFYVAGTVDDAVLVSLLAISFQDDVPVLAGFAQLEVVRRLRCPCNFLRFLTVLRQPLFIGLRTGSRMEW